MIVKKISMAEAARLCNISRVTLYSYIKKGIITPRKTPGGKSFFLPEDIEKLRKEINYGI